MDRRHGKTRPLAAALDSLIRDRGWDGRLAPYRVFEEWERICGPKLRGVTAPAEVRGRTLVVAVRDQAWANQASFMAEELRERANAVAGRDFFSGIRFIVNAERAGVRQEEERPRPLPRTGGAGDERLDKLLACVDDEEVRGILRKVWYRMKSGPEP